MTNDTVVLLHCSWKESRYILESYYRNVEAVAETYKTCYLVACIYVQNTGKEGRLISHDTYRASVKTSESHNCILSKVRHHLEQILVVQYRFYDILYVVRHVRILWYHCLQSLIHSVYVVAARNQRSIIHIVRWYETQQFAYAHQRLLFGRAHEMSHTTLAAMCQGTA